MSYKGEPVTRANNHAWHKALKRAGIEDFRWHDLRHTWASWHVQNGTPLHALQELGGWADGEMLRAFITPVSIGGGIMSHQQKSPAEENRRRALFYWS